MNFDQGLLILVSGVLVIITIASIPGYVAVNQLENCQDFGQFYINDIKYTCEEN